MKEITREEISTIEDVRDVTHNMSFDYVYEVTKRGVHLLWERIVAFIFSTDGFGIQTKDGYLVKFKE